MTTTATATAAAAVNRRNTKCDKNRKAFSMNAIRCRTAPQYMHIYDTVRAEYYRIDCLVVVCASMCFFLLQQCTTLYCSANDLQMGMMAQGAQKCAKRKWA